MDKTYPIVAFGPVATAISAMVQDTTQPTDLAALAPTAWADTRQTTEEIAQGEMLFLDPILPGHSWDAFFARHEPSAGWHVEQG